MVLPGDRLALLVESGGNAVEPVRPVGIVLDVFLTRPHDLHGAIDLFGDFDGADGAFEVTVNGRLIYSMLKTARHAFPGELVERVGQVLTT